MQPKYLGRLIETDWNADPGENLGAIVQHAPECRFLGGGGCFCDPVMVMVHHGSHGQQTATDAALDMTLDEGEVGHG